MEDNFNYEDIHDCTKALITALKLRDIHTELHSQRVIDLAEEIGIACNLSKNQISILKTAACFHDIGKIGIADEILLKNGKHNKEEFMIMQSHSAKGEDIVNKLKIENINEITSAIRHHHEHFNGNGYPDKLSGEDIPLYSRIISIADSYDAMTETRPYHKAKSHQEVMAILMEERGKKSDPKILDKFISIIENSKHKAA